MLVKEHINFERGQNPLKSMDIGMNSKLFIQSLDWGKDVNIIKVLDHYNIISIEQYKGFYLLTLQKIKVADEPTEFITITSPFIKPYGNKSYQKTPETAKNYMKNIVDEIG